MSGFKKGGWKPKYNISKTNGKPVDPNADYFVLRLDKDPHARKALRAYAVSVKDDNPQFAIDLWNKLETYGIKPIDPPSTPQVPPKSAKEFLESVQAEHFYEHGVYFDTFSKIAEVMEQYAQSKISEAEIADILFQTEESMVKEDEDVTIMEVINAQSKAIISKLER